MYIPTQKERYSKAARVTLLLCIVVPSLIVGALPGDADIVAAAYGINRWVFCLCGFLWPLAFILRLLGVTAGAALVFSGLLQTVLFWWMSRTRRFTSKNRLTFAVTWGMLFAFILRVLIAFEVWRLASSVQ